MDVIINDLLKELEEKKKIKKNQNETQLRKKETKKRKIEK